MAYKILIDATADMPVQEANALGIEVIPMEYLNNGKSTAYLPDKDISHIKSVYQSLRNGDIITTSQINPEVYKSHFEKWLKEGFDILYIGFSSGLSSSYQMSLLAADELKESYPERKICCVDTLAATLGEVLLVKLAVKNQQAGMGLSEQAKFLDSIKNNIVHIVTVDDLQYLRRGGRLSGASAKIGTLLMIKPLIFLNNEGKLLAIDKISGRKRSIKALVEYAQKRYLPEKNDAVYIAHGDCPEDAEYLASLIRKAMNPKEIIIDFVGPIIGAHSGPGTLTFIFFGKEK